VARERGRLRRVEHLEGDGGTAAALEHPAQEPRLELVVLGMVVALAEEREARRAHGRRQRVHRHEAALRDVPDPAGERMVVAEPRRGRLGRARDGGDDEEEGEGGETSHHTAMIASRW